MEKCMTKKCADKMVQLMNKENEYSLYSHLIKEHGIGTKKMAAKRDFAQHDRWKLAKEMEKDCMCGKEKSGMLSKLKNVGIGTGMIGATTLTAVEMAGVAGGGLIPLVVSVPLGMIGGTIGARQAIKEMKLERIQKIKKVI